MFRFTSAELQQFPDGHPKWDFSGAKPVNECLKDDDIDAIADDFKRKTYRCEWVTEVYVVDQYEQRQIGEPAWYEKAWPTYDEAHQDLTQITVWDEHIKGRRRYPGAKHSYYHCDVRYREVLET